MSELVGTSGPLPALLIIDMQHDFVDRDGSCTAPGAEEIVPPIVGLRDTFREYGLPVVLTQERHRPGRVDQGREANPGTGGMYGAGPGGVPLHCVVGTRGFTIVPELAPGLTDLVVEKPRNSCFIGSDLDLLLRGLGVDTLVVTGVCTNVCVLFTVAEAFQLDYHLLVVEDCLAGTSPAEHEAALTIMRGLLGTSCVVAVAAAIDWLQSSVTPAHS